MARGNAEPRAAELQAELGILATAPEREIDVSERSGMPAIKDWGEAVRGALYRPIKKPLSLRLDADVVAWFQQQGQGYQTRINSALREYIAQHEGLAGAPK